MILNKREEFFKDDKLKSVELPQESDLRGIPSSTSCCKLVKAIGTIKNK